MDENELKERLFEEFLLFLDRYPFCRCFGKVAKVKNGEKLLMDYEIEKVKLDNKRKRFRRGKAYKTILSEKIGLSEQMVKLHHFRHGKKQVAVVNDYLDRLVELFNEFKGK
jgi:hypothetical protein